MKRQITVLLLIISTSVFALNIFSPVYRNLFLEAVQKNQHYKLLNSIIENSETITADSLKLNKPTDYIIDYQNAEIYFKKDYNNVNITYMIIPPNLNKKFRNYFPTVISDTLLTKIRKKKKIFNSTANLNISGSKTVSFTISNQSDVSFDQTLFLKINGQLYDNMFIESQLSDNQTPILPEGNSQELSNLDKIFIRIYGKQYEFKFGDLEMEFSDTKFINYHPVFEGIKAKWFNRNYYKGAIALSKGKKGSSAFYASESKQGPYYLSVNNENGIKIVPGSEKIFLNGQILARGIDYTIDYSEGSITFTDKHFISSSSYITAYYLYSDENYKQNLYLANNRTEIGKHFEFYNFFIWEKDNKSNPLQQFFSDEDIAVLKQAGDNIPWGNGVTVAQDNKGEYKLSENGEYYIYAPLDSLAIYNIRFTYVGSGNGNYTLSENGKYYIYTGENAGDYVPKIKLIPPQNNLNYDFKTKFNYEFFRISAEGIITNHDKNSFSPIDDDDNISHAFYLGTNFTPDWDNLNPDLYIGILKKNKNLYMFSHQNDDNYQNRIISIPDTVSSLQKEVSISITPYKFCSIYGLYSYNNSKYFTRNSTATFKLTKKEENYFPFLMLTYTKQKQNLEIETADKKDVDAFSGMIRKKIKHITLKFEGNKQTYKNSNTFANFGFRETIGKSSIEYNKNKFIIKFSYNIASKDTLTNNFFNREYKKHTFGIEGKVKSETQFITYKLYHRIISLPQKQNFDMANINMRNAFFKNGVVFNSNYKIDNLEFYPKIRELIKVNYGLYDSTGTLGGEGGYDWVIKYIDYEHPQKSTEINFSTTLTIIPKSIYKKFPINLQTESYIQLYENSTSSKKRKLYLFDGSVFFNTTYSILSKKIIRQSFWLDIIKNKLKLRSDYKINNTLDQRYQNSAENNSSVISNELTYRYSLPISFKFLFEKESKQEAIYNSKFKSNNYEIGSFYRPNSYFMINTTLGYKTENAVSLLSNDNYQIKTGFIEENLTVFFKRKYRIFTKIKLEKTLKNTHFLDNISDKTEGLHLKTNLNINYRLNKFTSATIKYYGNLYSKAKNEHKISAEVKAEF